MMRRAPRAQDRNETEGRGSSWRVWLERRRDSASCACTSTGLRFCHGVLHSWLPSRDWVPGTRRGLGFSDWGPGARRGLGFSDWVPGT
eukprot:364790-Chlamydomonas_euryale.AAC.2